MFKIVQENILNFLNLNFLECFDAISFKSFFMPKMYFKKIKIKGWSLFKLHLKRQKTILVLNLKI